MIIFGFHAVEALLKSGQSVRAIHCLERAEGSRARIIKDLAQEFKVPFREYPSKDKIRYEAEFKRAGGETADIHSSQGIFAEFGELKMTPHLELVRAAKDKEQYPIILYLDNITDPQNLGSILRTAAFFGVAGLVITEHRSSPITPAALKISSGGFAHVPISRVTNLVHSLEEAKEEGFWIVGLSEHATEKFETARFDSPLCLVIGNEETGIRALTEKTCDFTVSLPGSGALISLNAGVATAVTLTLLRDKQPKSGKKKK